MKKCLTLTVVVLSAAGMVALLAACGGVQASTATNPMSDAWVTIAVAQTSTAAAEQATAAAWAQAAQETRVAGESTAAAGTAVAQATADEAAAISANETVVSAAATRAEDERLSANDQARVDRELKARDQDLAAAETINQQIIADNGRRLADEAARREREAQIAYWRGVTVTALIALIGVVACLLLAMMIYDRAHRIHRRDQALAALRGELPNVSKPTQPALPAGRGSVPGLTVTGPNGHQPRLAALPANQRVALLQQQTAALAGRAANWQEFSRWQEPDRVVIGVGVNGPIVLDLAQLPHIFAAGATRKGKSTLLRVILSYMATTGFNVTILNERSSDFAALGNNLPNVMNLRGFSDGQRLRLVQNAFAAAVEEMSRRDEILHASGIPTWRAYLQEHPQESPLLFLFVDEFLELTNGSRSVRNELMTSALTITQQAGKFGIGIGLNATDPTQRALGDSGYGVVQQCARICLGVNSTYASMSMLGDTSAFGLPAGQFVAIDHNGDRHAGVGFEPSPAELTNYLATRRPVVVKAFPPALAAVSRSLDQEETQPGLDAADPELSRIIEDAALIATLTDSRRAGTRSAICELLYEQGHIGWGRTGQNVQRVELALNYLAAKGNGWARGILAGSRSSSVGRAEAAAARGLAAEDAVIEGQAVLVN